jgi:hypothetical protein
MDSVTIPGFKIFDVVTREQGDILVGCGWGKNPTENLVQAISGYDAPQFGCNHYEGDFPINLPEAAPKGCAVVLCEDCERKYHAGARIVDEDTGRELREAWPAVPKETLRKRGSAPGTKVRTGL